MSLEAKSRVSQTDFFIVALGVGVISIAIGKSSDVLFLPLGIGLPVLLMLAYAAVNVRVGFLDSTRAQVADNAYFLGFLYFLVSLAITLWNVTGGEGLERRIEVEPIIRGFGIALVTTITGLFLRIILLQNIAGLTSSREKAEESLLVAVNRFSNQLTASFDLISHAHQAVLTSTNAAVERSIAALQEVVDTARRSAEAAMTVYTESMIAAAGRMKDELQGSIDEVRTKIHDVQIPADVLVSRMKPALDDLSATIGEVQKVVAGMPSAVASVTETMGNLDAKLTAFVETMAAGANAHSRATETLEGNAAALAQMAERFAGVAEELSKLHSSSERLQRTLENIPEASELATKSVREVDDVAKTLRQTLGDALQTVGQGTQQLDHSLAALQDGMRGAFRVLQDESTALTAQLERTRAATDGLESKLGQDQSNT